MSKAPPIPEEQRAFKGEKPDIAGRQDPHENHAGSANDDLKHKGDAANIRQNTSHSGNVQDR